jgi:hypothetical protein
MSAYSMCPGCGNKIKDTTRSRSLHIKNNPACATANLQDSIPVANNTAEDIVVQQHQPLATDDNEDDQSNNTWENAADDDDSLHALKGANDKDKVMADENSNSADDKSIVNLDETRGQRGG